MKAFELAAGLQTEPRFDDEAYTTVFMRKVHQAMLSHRSKPRVTY